MDEKEIKVTGTREFESGAHRDPNENKGRYDLLSPLFIRRLAVHTQKGGAARGDRNWEAGMPMDAVLDSAIRHLYAYLEGDRSEDHLAAAAWNVMNLIHTEEQIERGNLPADLADGLPDYTEKPKPKPEILNMDMAMAELAMAGMLYTKTIPISDVYPECSEEYMPYEKTTGPHEQFDEENVGHCGNHGDYDTLTYALGCPGCVKEMMNSEEFATALAKQEEPSCGNCVDSDKDGIPVPFSDPCMTCSRLGNWKGQPRSGKDGG